MRWPAQKWVQRAVIQSSVLGAVTCRCHMIYDASQHFQAYFSPHLHSVFNLGNRVKLFYELNLCCFRIWTPKVVIYGHQAFFRSFHIKVLDAPQVLRGKLGQPQLVHQCMRFFDWAIDHIFQFCKCTKRLAFTRVNVDRWPVIGFAYIFKFQPKRIRQLSANLGSFSYPFGRWHASALKIRTLPYDFTNLLAIRYLHQMFNVLCMHIEMLLTYTRSSALKALGSAGLTSADFSNVESWFLCMLSKQTARNTRIKCMHVCYQRISYVAEK